MQSIKFLYSVHGLHKQHFVVMPQMFFVHAIAARVLTYMTYKHASFVGHVCLVSFGGKTSTAISQKSCQITLSWAW